MSGHHIYQKGSSTSPLLEDVDCTTSQVVPWQSPSQPPLFQAQKATTQPLGHSFGIVSVRYSSGPLSPAYHVPQLPAKVSGAVNHHRNEPGQADVLPKMLSVLLSSVGLKQRKLLHKISYFMEIEKSQKPQALLWQHDKISVILR